MNDPAAAESAANEALRVYRQLVIENPDTYQVYVGMTLNLLGTIHMNAENFIAAEPELTEALDIFS